MDNLQEMSDKTNKNRQCDPCKQGNSSIVASVWCPTCVEALCENCSSYHKKLKPSREHEIKPISEMSEEETTLALLDNCQEHVGQLLEIHCNDHGVMCCRMCLKREHEMCENFSTFDEMVKGEKGNFEQNFRTQLLEVTEKTEEIINNTKEHLHKLKIQHVRITEHVSKYVQDAIRKLETLNSKFLKESKQDCDRLSTILEERMEEVVSFQKEAKNACQLLHRICSGENPQKIVIRKENLKKQLKSKFVLLKQELANPVNFEPSFEFDGMFKEVLDTVTSLGNLEWSHLQILF